MNHMLLDYHDLIEAIVSALEVRDCYTAHHSIRVSNMTEKICRLLSLSEEETGQIHIAADVHDIGKIGVPDQVLCKATALTEQEWEAMKRHSANGAGILSKVKDFGDIAELVLRHHERWDGKGYPGGLTADEIPFGARIIAVADSIDAMLSDRYYRKKLGEDKCKQEIEKNSGIMYDPQIACVVLKHWEEVVEARSIDAPGKRTSCDRC